MCRPLRLPDGVTAIDRSTPTKTFITLHLGDAKGRHLGNLSKLAEDPETTTPWQAFGPPPGGTEPNPLLGSFFQRDGRSLALSAILRLHNL